MRKLLLFLCSPVLLANPLAADKIEFVISLDQIQFATPVWTIKSEERGFFVAEPIVAPTFEIKSDYKLKTGDQLQCHVVDGTTYLRCEED